jgi:hypothetical protein
VNLVPQNDAIPIDERQPFPPKVPPPALAAA